MEERDTNLVKMRDNFFGAAGWDDLDYKEWKKSMNKFFHQASRVLKDGGCADIDLSCRTASTLLFSVSRLLFFYYLFAFD